jgi:hypothetical protein
VRLFNKKGGGSSGCKCRDYSIFNSRFELTFFHQQKPIFFSLSFLFFILFFSRQTRLAAELGLWCLSWPRRFLLFSSFTIVAGCE